MAERTDSTGQGTSKRAGGAALRTFDLWAPHAERVDLNLAGGKHAMSQRADGWWRVGAECRPGDLYSYSLDGGPDRPDPRSRFQPEGVHGRSQVVDDEAYEWAHPAFRAAPLGGAVLYELHLGTFTAEGTLDAAIGKLDHLVELGITHVEILPLNAYDGERGWGYDGVLWSAPHSAYTGPDGPDAVKRFVDACHGRGMAVILDVVYNHLGPSGNYLPEFGPYVTSAYNTVWGDALNLDQAHAETVRRFICDSALLWLREYRFDGLRLDAVHALRDSSATHVIEQLAREVKMLEADEGRPLVLISESDLNDPRVIRPLECGGWGTDAQWLDDFHHALHTVATGERDGYYVDFGAISQLAKSLEGAFVHDGGHSPIRKRRHGRSAAGMLASSFVVCIQNHDQIGNRAQGDRIGATLNDDQLKTCAAIVLLSPFVPMLFQGEEWAASTPFQYFADHDDPKLADAVRTGRRAEFSDFGWKPEDVPDPEDRATFERSRLDWSEVGDGRHAELLDWHRRLIALRRSTPGIGAQSLGSVRTAFDDDEGWFVFRNAGLIVACWFASGDGAGGANEERRIPLGGVVARERQARQTEAASDTSGFEAVLASNDRCRVDGDHAIVTRGGCVIVRDLASS